MDFLSLIEILTQIATLGMMSSGICSCYAYYGVLENNKVLIFLNTVGVILNTTYVMAYLYTIQSKAQPFVMFCCVILYLILLNFYLLRTTSTVTAYAKQLGFMGCLTCTLTMCTPILEVIDCLQRKSSENVSTEILMGTMVCGMMWLTYGNLLGDPYLYVPNIPGIVTGSMKFGMLYMYPAVKAKGGI